jgi:hypothetical protein
MAKSSQTDATDSAIGFYFQACYALIVLLDSGDDDSVSVETADDVEQLGSNPTLQQLKHSLGKPGQLTEKNDGFWKTIGIWLKVFPLRKHRFVFVTCAEIDATCSLLELASTGSRTSALNLLVGEASRVIDAVTKAASTPATKGTNASPPYKDRIGPCREFLKLPQPDREEFLKRITIIHRNFNATKLAAEVEKRLSNYKKATRSQLAELLLQWWDRRVAQSLTKQASREITKEELLDRLHMLNDQLADDNLPDHFSFTEPPSLMSELGSMMEEQIKLVGGGAARVSRAAKARWRARNQRNRWLSSNIGLASELTQFDARLIENWQERHGPLCDDCTANNWDEAKKASEGLSLLEWSHHEAPQTIPPVRPKWDKAFFTQGTFQQLADEKKVGWHPEYEARLSPPPKPVIPKKAPKATKKASKKTAKAKGGQSKK